MRQAIIGMMILAAGLFAALPAAAQPTEVSGSVSGTWSGMVHVTGDVTVEAGDQLTIEPGTTVEFQGPYRFDVLGLLVAEGSHDAQASPQDRIDPRTDVQWITFTQDTSGLDLSLPESGGDLGAGWSQLWRGLRFVDSQNGCSLEWVIVEWGYARGEWPLNNGGGIFVRATSPAIQNVVVRHCAAENFGGGAYLWSTASNVRNVVLAHNYAASAGGGLYVNMSAIPLRSLTVARNYVPQSAFGGNGIFFGPGTEHVVESSIFYANYPTTRRTQDEAVFFSGYDNDYLGDFRYNFATSMDDDLTRGIIGGGENAGQDSATVLFEVDHGGFYTLDNASSCIDAAVPEDTRYTLEPQPNGGPTGPRLNMGAWGGTVAAARSLPVVKPPDQAFADLAMKPGESIDFSATIENVGAGLLILSHDSLEWHSQTLPPRFELPAFDTKSIRPDSVDVIPIVFTPQAGDELRPNGTLIDTMLVNTNGGSVLLPVKGTAKNPEIFVDTTAIDFGEVAIGSPDTMTLEIENRGTTELIVGFDFRNSESAFTVLSGGRNIPADTAHTFSIVCNPDQIQSLDDEMRIGGNDEPATIRVLGFGRGPVPSYPDVDSLYFAFVDTDSSRSRTLEIINNGNADYEVEDITFTNAAYSVNPSPPLTVPERDTLNLEVVFAPQTRGIYSDTMTIDAGLDRYDMSYRLWGRGTSGGRYFSGDIPSEENEIPEVWSTDVSQTFVCAGPTRIPPGEELTILKNVQIRFEKDAYIVVEGRLEALGEEGSEILFAPLDTVRHGGVRFFASTPGSRMEHVIIDSARTWSIEEIAAYEGISEDSVEINIPDYRAHGGGISIYNTDPYLYEVEVRNSYSHADGGGVWVYQSQPTLIRLSVHDNLATTHGGGVSLFGAHPNLHAAHIFNNTAGDADAGTVGNGGGVYFRSNSNALFTNSIVTGNHAIGKGAGLYLTDYSAPLMSNNVVYGNTADDGGDAIYLHGNSLPILKNSVVANHPGSSLAGTEDSDAIASYSVIEGGADGTDIYDVVPQFNATSDPPFQPTGPGSNLVDQGERRSTFEDFSRPPSLGGVRNDVGAYGGPWAGYWTELPLQLSFFQNPTNDRGLHFVVNALEALSGSPSITVETFGDSVDAEVNEVDGALRVWAANFPVSESAFMQVRVRATTSGGQDVMTRRDFGVAVYTAGVGGSYDDPSGGKLRMDARTASRDMLVVSREVVSATRPEGAALVQTAGPRWVLDAPRERWSGTAELSLPFDREVVPAGAESGVAIWQQLEEEWVRLDSRVDAEKGLVQAEISGAGTFAVFYEPAGGVSDLLPTRTALGANYPNPFNPTTTIPFDLAVTSEVKLSVYNVLGQQVATLVSDLQGAGRHHVVWNGRDRFDRQVASGVYFYRIETKPVDGSAGIVQTRKLVLMR